MICSSLILSICSAANETIVVGGGGKLDPSKKGSGISLSKFTRELTGLKREPL